ESPGGIGIAKGSAVGSKRIFRVNVTPQKAAWIEKYGNLIGKSPDWEVAKLAGKTAGYVKKIRLQQGMHFERRNRPWSAGEERLLGKHSDREVARLLIRNV